MWFSWERAGLNVWYPLLPAHPWVLLWGWHWKNAEQGMLLPNAPSLLLGGSSALDISPLGNRQPGGESPSFELKVTQVWHPFLSSAAPCSGGLWYGFHQFLSAPHCPRSVGFLLPRAKPISGLDQLLSATDGEWEQGLKFF